MLASFGFVPNAEQTPEALLGIQVMFSLIPGALAIGNSFVLLFYPLTEKDTAEIGTQLAERRLNTAT